MTIFLLVVLITLVLVLVVINYAIFLKMQDSIDELWEAIDGIEDEEDEQDDSPTPGDGITRNKIVYFVQTALKEDGPGLAIGRWKSEEKWAQSDVESVLDYLADLGLITERRNGVACQWLEERLGKIIQKIDLSPYG